MSLQKEQKKVNVAEITLSDEYNGYKYKIKEDTLTFIKSEFLKEEVKFLLSDTSSKDSKSICIETKNPFLEDYNKMKKDVEEKGVQALYDYCEFKIDKMLNWAINEIKKKSI